MAGHFDPLERRDWHGRWVRGAGQRPGFQPPDEARARETNIDVIIEKVKGIPLDKKLSINGVTIAHIPKGLRVSIPGQGSKHYGSMDDPEVVRRVARAALIRAHAETDVKEVVHRAKERKIKEILDKPGPAPEPVPGAPKVAAIPIIPDFRTRYPGRSPENDKKIRLAIRHATDIQRQWVPHIVNSMTVEVRTRMDRGKWAMANMRSGMAVVQSPHRDTGEERIVNVWSHMNVRADTMMAVNGNDIRDQQFNSNWWVRADPQYSLQDVVIAHETGHAVHGLLDVNGIQGFGWSSQVTNQESIDFWNGLADAAGVRRPLPLPIPEYLRGTSADQPTYDIQAWLSHNRAKLTRAISRYGTKKNTREMAAELWCEYTLNSNPRPAAKYYGDFVMRKLANKDWVGAKAA